MLISDLSGSLCIKAADESLTRVDSSAPLMHHDPDRSLINTDPDPDHPKGTPPRSVQYCCKICDSHVLFECLRKHLNGIRIPLKPCRCIDEELRDVSLGVQNTQQTVVVFGDATWRSHVGSWFPVDGVIVRTS